jgi:flagellar protein FlbD
LAFFYCLAVIEPEICVESGTSHAETALDLAVQSEKISKEEMRAMIKVTRLDGSEMYINEDLFEIIEETPDTHITLTNGNRYLVRESASVLMEKIVCFKSRILARVWHGAGRKYLRRKMAREYLPICRY